MAQCPDCGQETSADTGSSTPWHQKSGSNSKCSGTGKKAV